MEHQRDYTALLAKKLKRVMALEHNKETVGKFNDILGKIKSNTCEVKYGMASGDSMGFTLAYTKGGNKEPLDLFIENIPDKEFNYGFLFGLNPEIFHFNPVTYVSDETHDYLMFKLLKNVE